MADKLIEDVKAFLDDVVGDLTNLHVSAAQWRNAPSDQDAVDALAQLPAGLIDRAQALSREVEKAQNQDGKPKAAAKHKAAAKT